jgi:hypothetical protein
MLVHTEDMTDVRIPPTQMPEELRDRIQVFARNHGGMAFAAAVRYLLSKGLEQESSKEKS